MVEEGGGTLRKDLGFRERELVDRLVIQERWELLAWLWMQCWVSWVVSGMELEQGGWIYGEGEEECGDCS